MKNRKFCLLVYCFLAIAPCVLAKDRIVIGTEYVLVDRDWRVPIQAQMLAPIRLPAAKIYVEHMEWGEMQKRQNDPISFSRVDSFVREFQENRFTDLVLCFKSRSPWASKAYSLWNQGNPTPKPEFIPDYEKWVSAVVERYDHDGHSDMPGLRFAVVYYEVGSEFSSYEPETPREYLGTLEVAYRAAHSASPDVKIAHAAFLTTNAFKDNPSPSEYEAAFDAAGKWMKEHSLSDIRKVLDRPDLFDLLNVHSIGDPYEIEGIAKWLRYETKKRNYTKPMIISDTAVFPFIAWGPATVCNLDPSQMGSMIAPATEEDRCRMAAYFTKLINGDNKTVQWVQGFAGTDNIKKVVVAAEQGFSLINTNYVEDLFWLKLPLLQAGAGNSAWAGVIDVDKNERRSGFYALQQIVRFLRHYKSITRLDFPDNNVRVYELTEKDRKKWIAWYEADRVLLPQDSISRKTVRIQTEKATVTVEETITNPGQTDPFTMKVSTTNGIAAITLTTKPVFIH